MFPNLPFPSSPMTPTPFAHRTAINHRNPPPLLPTPHLNLGYPYINRPNPPSTNFSRLHNRLNQAPLPIPPPYPCTVNQQPNNQNPSQNHFSRWSRKHIQNSFDNNEILNLYVENIPLRWTPMDLHLILAKFGDILDVYIPTKLSKLGRRFSFVRFKKPANLQSLITHINSISADEEHLSASLARGKKDKTFQPTRNTHQNPHHLAKRDTNNAFIKNNISFADTVKSNENTQVLPNIPESKKGPLMTFIPKAISSTWLNSCLFAILKHPMPIDAIHQLLSSHDLHDVKIIPLGGVSFLFRFSPSEDLANFNLQNHPQFLDFFDLLRPWQTGDAAHNRLCWVSIKGIPVQAWTKEFFDLLAIKFGN
ncbi:hypothetical protein Tsubulata_040512 [Turnera subulata]|uniref:RRM domain-containing protein n=1 Tax=Turnera subulata TaxID=218843 RepID=A0A9Q0FPI3_9ROSI|nr:hypothetical protein Tsubulata_040512 [Turnera subulata]